MGQPSAVHPAESRRKARSDTRRIETSKYPEEKKTQCDSLSSGERTGKSLNAICVKPECVANRGLWGFRGEEFGLLTK